MNEVTQEAAQELPEFLSLGAGVQSSTLALLADRGEVTPMPKAAIFADTQAEPASVYRWLDYLESIIKNFPVIRVTWRNLESEETRLAESQQTGLTYRKTNVPMFTTNMYGEKGILPRKCTTDFKIKPVQRKVKELAGIPRGCKELRARQWIGISTDEAIRMKPSREPWVESRWPLIEMGWSRKKCLEYWGDLPKPPRSACVFCPYHSDREWVRLRTEEPQEFERAVALEKKIQAQNKEDLTTESTPYFHDSRVPLDQVVFKPEKERDKFGNECEGMCGV